jgi:uncharacterized membrane protein
MLRGSIWALPLVAAVLGVLLSFLAVELEGRVTIPGWSYSSSTAMTVLTTVVAAAVGLTGFVVTVSVLAVQTFTGTFSPRYMRLWYRDRVLKAVLAVLVGSLTFAFSLLRRIEGDAVPDLGVTVAGALLGVGVVLFLAFLDRVLHRMRPVMVAALVARAGRATMAAAARDAAAGGGARDGAPPGGAPSLVVRSDRPGAIQAIDRRGLVGWAGERGAVVVMRHAVGDFVSSGGALLEVHGTAPQGDAPRRLRGMVALGIERTLEQDPAFALRILVDIAIRALSPAVNDPTTAVQVIDHLEDTLTAMARTPGLGAAWEHRDVGGALRVVEPTPRWEDLLALGVTEIRDYGARSVQVARRLRAALEALRAAALPEYVPAVEDELARLERRVAESFGPVEAERASTPDRQGIGGPPEPRP